MPLEKEDIVDARGERFVRFRGLLKLAHEAGFEGHETKIEQINAKENGNHAVVIVTATFRSPEDGGLKVFTSVGNADDRTTQIPDKLAMAETRGLARCFRIALNRGETALEELEEAHPARGGAGPSRPSPGPESPANGGGDEGPWFCQYEGCGVQLTPGQVKVSRGKFNTELCPVHQREAATAAR